MRHNKSICTADDDGDESEEIVTFSAISTLQATYRDVTYSVHYLDLTEDEVGFFKMHDLSSSNFPFCVKRCHIRIDENTLSIQRLNVPSAQDDRMSEVTKTERIYFTKCEPLMAKCERNFFFVHENLENEYKMLLTHTKEPMGTAIRVKKNRIITNRKENVLNILEPNVELCDDYTIFVLKPDTMDSDATRVEYSDDNEQWHRYLVNADNELVVVEQRLIYDSNCREIFADFTKKCSIPVDDEAVARQTIKDNAEESNDQNEETSSTSSEEEFIS